jgi:hypothetical protein
VSPFKQEIAMTLLLQTDELKKPETPLSETKYSNGTSVLKEVVSNLIILFILPLPFWNYLHQLVLLVLPLLICMNSLFFIMRHVLGGSVTVIDGDHRLLQL